MPFVKGSHHSEGTKRKISTILRGKKRSEETKKRLSQSKMGSKNPMYGKFGQEHPKHGYKYTEKQKQRISDASKGRTPWNKGMAMWSGKDHPRGMLGKKHSNEAKQKMSTSQKGLNIWSKNRELSDEHKHKIAEASRNLWQDPEYRRRVTEKVKQRWQNPDYRDKVVKAVLKSLMRKPTKPEQKLIDLIKKRNLPFKYVGDGSVIFYGMNPDFIECNGEKKIIEVFGDYWHSERADNWKDTEWGKKAVYSQLGYDCLVIWEHEIKNTAEDEIVERIKTFSF